ncbi:hypothetical protein WJX72_007750 [[Myrmecia] bisecta]|uniref:Uncharacterized protein n=1 Tax=[Myrmecia] bisecta TaxID=41462 RepID=A0AAW1PWP0_9CHLO
MGRVDSPSAVPEIQPEAEALLDVNDPEAIKPRTLGTTSNPKQALYSMASSYMSRRFLSGCAVLFPMVVTVYVTWWFLTFFDNFFSPLYQILFGFHVFGLGFVTSMAFIFMTGIFVSSWVGGLFLRFGEWVIRKLPLVKHIYSAAKQVSAAVNPGNETTQSFRECVMIRHPRQGEFAFGFITGQTMLQDEKGLMQQLYSVYVPTNHIYVGDVFLLGNQDIIKTNLSVREGLEIVVSVGMALPPNLTSLR